MNRIITNIPFIDNVFKTIIKYASIIGLGAFNAFESTVVYFIFCVILTLGDVWSAFILSKRVSKENPKLTEGKFQSRYARRIFNTLIKVFLALILGSFVDDLILRCGDQDIAVRFVAGYFLFIQMWSILENCSSANNSPWAKILQKIMVNKAERYLNINLNELKDENKNDNIINNGNINVNNVRNDNISKE